MVLRRYLCKQLYCTLRSTQFIASMFQEARDEEACHGRYG